MKKFEKFRFWELEADAWLSRAFVGFVAVLFAVAGALFLAAVLAEPARAGTFVMTSPEDYQTLLSLDGQAEIGVDQDWSASWSAVGSATLNGLGRDFLEYEVSEADALPLAQTILGEAGSDYISTAEKAMVGWTILNRLDDGWAGSVLGVVSAPGQFAGYLSWATPPDEIMELARDVLRRYAAEKAGEVNVGRVLPPGYVYFYGDGSHNYFSGGGQGTGYSFEGYPSPY